MSPISHSDRGDDLWTVGKPTPGVGGSVDDLGIGLEDAVGEPVRAQVLPDLFDRVQLRRSRRQEDQRHIFRDGEIAGGVPAGAVEQQDGVRSPSDHGRDLVEVQLHGLGADVGESQRGADTARRTDRAEQTGVLVALVGRLAGPRSAPCPLSNDAVLLSDPSLVLEPDFDTFALGQMSDMSVQGPGEVFLNSSMTFGSCPGCRGRALM